MIITTYYCKRCEHVHPGATRPGPRAPVRRSRRRGWGSSCRLLIFVTFRLADFGSLMPRRLTVLLRAPAAIALSIALSSCVFLDDLTKPKDVPPPPTARPTDAGAAGGDAQRTGRTAAVPAARPAPSPAPGQPPADLKLVGLTQSET